MPCDRLRTLQPLTDLLLGLLQPALQIPPASGHLLDGVPDLATADEGLADLVSRAPTRLVGGLSRRRLPCKRCAELARHALAIFHARRLHDDVALQPIVVGVPPPGLEGPLCEGAGSTEGHAED